jgi:hypothetical protein
VSEPTLATIWVEGHGWKPAILFAGRKWTRAIIITPSLVVVRQTFTMKTPLAGPLSKVAKQFRGVARRHGATKEARELLRGL